MIQVTHLKSVCQLALNERYG